MKQSTRSEPSGDRITTLSVCLYDLFLKDQTMTTDMKA